MIGGLGTIFAKLGASGKRGIAIVAPPDTFPPNFTSSATVSVDENLQLSHLLTTDEASTFTITGGADSSHFQLTANELQWLSDGTKDFEAAHGVNYVVQVTATDAASNTRNQTITVTVLNVVEPPDNIIAPVVTGSLSQGSTLTCTTTIATDWTGDATIVPAYQWFRTEAVVVEFLTDGAGVTLTDSHGVELTT